MFDAAIEAFLQVGNVAQLTITLASATALFERIDRLDAAATLHDAVARLPGSAHHVPDLPELAVRLEERLGAEAFRAHSAQGAGMGLGDAARFARLEIQRARDELRVLTLSRAARPGGLSAREVEVLRLAAEGLTTREIAHEADDLGEDGGPTHPESLHEDRREQPCGCDAPIFV